jgi:hypothetical protein
MKMPKITGTKAAGPHQLAILAPWAARFAQFRRSAKTLWNCDA